MYFVTRQKVNAKYKVTARFAVNWLQGVTSDQNVVLRGKTGPAYPDALRRVGYRDPETGNHYVFWTNALKLAATTIAAIYKARWQIELFFKTIKQNLKITKHPCSASPTFPDGDPLVPGIRLQIDPLREPNFAPFDVRPHELLLNALQKSAGR